MYLRVNEKTILNTYQSIKLVNNKYSKSPRTKNYYRPVGRFLLIFNVQTSMYKNCEHHRDL